MGGYSIYGLCLTFWTNEFLDGAVQDLPGSLHYADVVCHSRAARLSQKAHGSLHVTAHVLHPYAVHLHASTNRIAHGSEHGSPDGVLAHASKWLGRQAEANGFAGA